MDIGQAINGSVYSQGVKLDYKCWLDCGSQEWRDTSTEQKAAAYQAAKVCGWTDVGLIKFIIKQFSPRIDEFMANVTIETLQEYAEQFPIEIMKVYEAKKENPEFKIRGNDKTFKLDN